MWYNTDNKKPRAVCTSRGVDNLLGRLSCVLYHKDASVLIARCGRLQASLSVSQVNPISYGRGVSRVPLAISSDTVIRWLRAYVRIAARSINAGMVKADTAIRAAPRAALPIWSKAKECGSSVSSVGACFHQTEAISNTVPVLVRRWRFVESRIRSAAAHTRKHGGLLCIPALAATQSFAVSRIQSALCKSIVRIGATCDVARCHTLRTA